MRFTWRVTDGTNSSSAAVMARAALRAALEARAASVYAARKVDWSHFPFWVQAILAASMKHASKQVIFLILTA